MHKHENRRHPQINFGNINILTLISLVFLESSKNKTKYWLRFVYSTPQIRSTVNHTPSDIICDSFNTLKHLFKQQNLLIVQIYPHLCNKTFMQINCYKHDDKCLQVYTKQIILKLINRDNQVDKHEINKREFLA